MAFVYMAPFGFGAGVVTLLGYLIHRTMHVGRDLALSEQPMIFSFNEASLGGRNADDLQGLMMNMTAVDRAVFAADAMGETVGSFTLNLQNSHLGLIQGDFSFLHPLGGDLPITGLWTTYTPPSTVDAVREHFTETHHRLAAAQKAGKLHGTADADDKHTTTKQPPSASLRHRAIENHHPIESHLTADYSEENDKLWDKCIPYLANGFKGLLSGDAEAVRCSSLIDFITAAPAPAAEKRQDFASDPMHNLDDAKEVCACPDIPNWMMWTFFWGGTCTEVCKA